MANNNLTSNLQAISDALPEAIKQALDNCGVIVENDAKEKCPVDTGTLRRSIKHKTKKTKVTIGTNVEYAIPVHEGHGSYTGSKFLEKALYENWDKIKEQFEGLLEERCDIE